MSPVWQGNLTLATPPSIAGRLRVDELVIPVPGELAGRMGRRLDQTQWSGRLRDPDRGRLRLAHRPQVRRRLRTRRHGARSVLCRRVSAGRRSGAGPGPSPPLDAAVSPYGHPLWPAEGNTAVALVGRIGRGHRRAVREPCGPKPQVEAWISSRGVAKVSCPFGCEATLVAGQAGEQRPETLRVPSTGATEDPDPRGSTHPTRPGGPPRRYHRAKLRRLGAGRGALVVEVGGADLRAEAQSTCLPEAQRKAPQPGDGKR